jgi:putative transposase
LSWRTDAKKPVYRRAESRHSSRADAERPVADVARTHVITSTTFYRWKAKYGGLQLSEARRLRQLEDENQRLKHVVADLTLDNRVLKGLLEKK